MMRNMFNDYRECQPTITVLVKNLNKTHKGNSQVSWLSKSKRKYESPRTWKGQVFFNLWSFVEWDKELLYLELYLLLWMVKLSPTALLVKSCVLSLRMSDCCHCVSDILWSWCSIILGLKGLGHLRVSWLITINISID